MKNKAVKGLVFILIRTILEAIGVVLFTLTLYLQVSNVVVFGLIVFAFINIFLAIIPHFFVKDISFGFMTLFNFLSQIVLAGGMFALLLFFCIIDTSDAAGWLIFLLIFYYVFFIPVAFFVNLIVDLITYFIMKKIRGGVKNEK